MNDQTAAASKPDAKQETIETIKSLGVILLIVLVLRIFLFQPFTIPSGSMKPNLLVGDYIVVSKFTYGFSKHSIPFSPPLFKGRIFGSSPKRGDVIVFKTPANNRTDLIKRVMGLPGDTIQVTGGVVTINGKALPRVADGQGNPDACGNGATPTRFIETNPAGKRYATYDCGPDGPLDDTQAYVVPEGHYFFMGDNRDNSLDSRVPADLGGVGFVPAENLVGKAQIILASWEDVSLFKPWTWLLNIRTDRFVHPIK